MRSFTKASRIYNPIKVIRRKNVNGFQINLETGCLGYLYSCLAKVPEINRDRCENLIHQASCLILGPWSVLSILGLKIARE